MEGSAEVPVFWFLHSRPAPPASVHKYDSSEARIRLVCKVPRAAKDLLFPTQATVQKTFSRGEDVLQTMLQMVQTPEHISKLPLMSVAASAVEKLGRRSPFPDSPQRQVWLSADNRRCFMFKVIAPLCALEHVRVARIDWTPEMDAKLMQCPQTNAWATDLTTIEAVRHEVIELLSSRPLKIQRLAQAASGFDARADYISKLNLHLQQSRRPHVEQARIADYRELLRSDKTFRYEVEVEGRVFRGDVQAKVMKARQSAAYAACVELGIL